ncbi:uncharacterized protein TNCV_4224551 [Trichonephila clavipes]|nr:uncharacterized protein TNCV_4224551 [Trichonephila clavipes]
MEDLEKKLQAGGNENKGKREAAKILQTLPDAEQLNLNFLCNSLDLQFGQKYSKEYARLQMKTRLQKTRVNVQEYTSEVERLANLAFSDHPATVREAKRLNQEKRNFKCWECGGTGYLRRNCPQSRKEENTVSSSKQEN